VQSGSIGCFGVHRQTQPLVVYFGNAANSSLDYTQSIHYVLGYSNRLASDLLFKAETYYKDITNAPIDRDSLSALVFLIQAVHWECFD